MDAAWTQTFEGGKQMTNSTSNRQGNNRQSGNWQSSPRWRGITRPYSQSDVSRLQGSFHIEHTLARHGAERMSDQMVATVGATAAAVALSATLSGRSRAYVPAMMAAVGAGATVGFILPMSRAQESEADRIGLVLMALAGYDPREAITVRERMHAANTGRRQAEWLSTHPADTTRLADIRQWLPEAMKYYRPRN